MVTLTPLQKEKKNKKTKPICGSSYLGNAWRDLNVGVLMVEGISTAKIVRFRTSSTKLHMRENCIIVLPVNTFTGVAHHLLGPHDTQPCVLIH